MYPSGATDSMNSMYTINVYTGILHTKSSWHHPEVKEPYTSFWYSIHKASPVSHYAKLHIPPTSYWHYIHRPIWYDRS